tara:strand:+ start:204242 stop:205522 length:1281 start_codon:yes stop_codon:yes gene_type:complete
MSKPLQLKVGIETDSWKVDRVREYLELLTDFEANGSFKDTKENVEVVDNVDYAWYVRATDLENKTSLSNVRYVTEKSYNFLKKAPLFGGELLITKRGEIGKVYFFEDRNVKATLGPNLYLLKMKNSINSKFLYYYFLNEEGNSRLRRINASTTLGALYKEDVKNLYIPVPELKEQDKITEILTSVDEVIELTEAEIEKLKNLKKGMMQDLLTKGIGHTKFKDSPIGKIPESWDVKKLQSLCEKIVDGTHHTPSYTELGVPFLRVGDIQTATTPIPQKFISQEEHILLKKRVSPKRGDILLSKNGTVGIPRIVDWDWEFSIFVSLAHIRIKDSSLNNQFLVFVLESEVIKEQMRKRSKQGTVTNLHLEEIREFDIPVPSKEEQTDIIAGLSSVNNLLNLVESKHRKLNEMKKGLMQDLLTGKVRVKV